MKAYEIDAVLSAAMVNGNLRHTGIRHLLPATAMEIAALVGCTVKQANARLCNLAKVGAAMRSGNKLPNGNEKQGAHNSALWLRLK